MPFKYECNQLHKWHHIAWLILDFSTERDDNFLSALVNEVGNLKHCHFKDQSVHSWNWGRRYKLLNGESMCPWLESPAGLGVRYKDSLKICWEVKKMPFELEILQTVLTSKIFRLWSSKFCLIGIFSWSV